jgi:hypothetical protein
MFQSVAYVSGTVSYFAALWRRDVTLCKYTTKTVVFERQS